MDGLNAKERLMLAGWWMMLGIPAVGSAAVAFGVVYNPNSSLPVDEWWFVASFVALFGGVTGVLGIILYRQTRGVFRIARQRKLKGCCRICGYSLRGNESGVCPECGTKTKIPTASVGGDKRND